MRTKLTTLLLAGLVLAVMVAANDPAAEIFEVEPVGRGWVAPTTNDKQLIRQHGSRLGRVWLNLRGLGRLIRGPRDDAPGAAAPPTVNLVRAPGQGVQFSRYTEPPPDATSDDKIANYPRAVDNSELPCFPPIFAQGELNSCTSVAVTYYQLTHMTGLIRGWDQKRAGAGQRFSPMWTFNLINGGNNRGTFQSRAYAALLAHGAATLKEMPYHSSPTPATNYRRWPDNPRLWQDALDYRIEGFGFVQEQNVVKFLRRIKPLLVNGHVLTAATGIDGWNRTTITDNPNSRLDNPYVGESIATAVSPVPGNHCITIVGYNDDIWVDLNGNEEIDPGEKGALKIANSWGTSDWNRGFRWLHYAALSMPREEESEVRQAALFWNQAFWMNVSRDYEPALVMQVDLPPMFRNEFSLAAGVGPFKADFFDTLAPNFAFDYNGGRFGIDGRGAPQDIHAVLDLTRPARRYLAQDPQISVRIVRRGNRPVLPRARLVEPATGVVHELVLSRSAVPDVYTARAPTLATLGKSEFRLTVPAQLDLPRNAPASIPIALDGTSATRRQVDIRVFSCNASVLATNDLAVERAPDGTARLVITPPGPAAGSCVLMVHATDGTHTTSTAIRVNLLAAGDVPPVIEPGPARREGLQVRVPFRIKTSGTAVENAVAFFDTSNVDQVGSYEISGTGADRLLTIKLRYWAPFTLSLSALDGRFVGATSVQVGS